MNIHSIERTIFRPEEVFYDYQKDSSSQRTENDVEIYRHNVSLPLTTIKREEKRAWKNIKWSRHQRRMLVITEKETRLRHHISFNVRNAEEKGERRQYLIRPSNSNASIDTIIAFGEFPWRPLQGSNDKSVRNESWELQSGVKSERRARPRWNGFRVLDRKSTPGVPVIKIELSPLAS